MIKKLILFCIFSHVLSQTVTITEFVQKILKFDEVILIDLHQQIHDMMTPEEVNKIFPVKNSTESNKSFIFISF